MTTSMISDKEAPAIITLNTGKEIVLPPPVIVMIDHHGRPLFVTGKKDNQNFSIPITSISMIVQLDPI